MAHKGIVILSVVVLSMSCTLPRPAEAFSPEAENSKLTVLRDAALQEGDPSKCPIGQECEDQSEIHFDPDAMATVEKASLPPEGFGEKIEGDNSVISSDLTDRALNDAALNMQEPEAGTQLPKSRPKGRPNANKKLKRKSRRRKCRQRQRKLKLERKMGKRSGKAKKGRKGMGKRRGKKGRKNKRRKKCGMGKEKRKMKNKKDRRRRKNERKRKNGKLTNDNVMDISNTTAKTILDSIPGVQETEKEKNVDIKVLGSEVKEIDTNSKQLDTDTSSVAENTEGTTRYPKIPENTGKIGIDSNEDGLGDGGTSSTSSGEAEFDAVQITAMFQEALLRGPDGQTFVKLKNYVKAYKRLASVFHFFGPIFSFAKSELEEKIDILGQLYSSNIKGQDGENYDTFKTMFEYEYRNGIAQPGGPGTSGVRENAWIHRALKFIIAIVRTVADKTDTSPLHSRVKQFYSEILAPHHSWIVRMGVYAAIYSFPSRETLLNDMKITDDAEGMRHLTRLAESLQAVYDLIQARYEKYAPPK